MSRVVSMMSNRILLRTGTVAALGFIFALAGQTAIGILPVLLVAVLFMRGTAP